VDKKTLGQVEIKDETKGEVEAVFATLNVKDKDDDVTVKGAFTEGAEVVISAYGHKSWEGALPVGKGTIHEVGDKVVMKGQFFMNTTGGRDTFEVVKALGSKGEWSYGFDVLDSSPGEHEGKSVRVLKSMSVHEVSPVLRGAGEGTRTVSAKGSGPTLNEEISLAVVAVRGAVKSAERVVALRAENGDSLSKVNADALTELKASAEALATIIAGKVEEADADGEELDAMWLSSLAETLETE
jgi:hypothetical protein